MDEDLETTDAPTGVDAPVEAPAPEEAPAASFRVVSAESVTFDLSDASPHVHLMESEAPFRFLSIPIALPEAVALHQALGNVAGRRPGTHELASEILARLRADVVAARIVRYEGGVYYAELDLMGPRGREVLDCRTSDAIILAVRQKVPAPILCAEEVLAEASD
ncbi:MAG: bifunctional nuclease family protein [Acidobacteriota bacterium]|nr:bifunctional nuclease family protein [Acidobacteriota bacterium]